MRTVLAAILTLFLLSPATQADVLRGQLSGLHRPSSLVDIRFRFFADENATDVLAELFITGVALRNGYFEVEFNDETVPSSADYVQLALRPNERHYAIYNTISPRRPLLQVRADFRMAQADPEDGFSNLSADSVVGEFSGPLQLTDNKASRTAPR